MKRALLILLLFATGCATLSTPAPVSPVAGTDSKPQVEPAPAPQEIKEPPATPATQETVKTPPSPFTAQPPPSPEHPAPSLLQESTAPSKETLPPAVPQKQEKTSRASRDLPVPDYKLQGLVNLALKNDDKIMNVFVGMDKKAVEDVMGGGQNPFKRQTVTGIDNQKYEILYYLTREPRKGRPITDRMLTPVIFKKGRVAAIGAYHLKKLLRTGTLGRQKPGAEVPPASS